MDLGQSSPWTALVVDDEESVRLLVRKLLESDGFVVLEAADGEEALRVAELHAGKIRVLLTDVLMPGRSGPEVARLLQHRQPGLRVVFMSGFKGETDLDEALEDQRAFFVQKPFSRITLLTAVRASCAAP